MKMKNQRTKVEYVQKVPTGIEGFEHVSMGGIPKSRTTLLSGTSGSGKTIMALEFLWKGVTRFKENGVFVTFEETPNDIVKNVKSLGWDFDILEKQSKIGFVDASPSPDDKEIVGTYDFSALLARIEYAINKVKAKRLAMDSISVG